MLTKVKSRFVWASDICTLPLEIQVFRNQAFSAQKFWNKFLFSGWADFWLCAADFKVFSWHSPFQYKNPAKSALFNELFRVISYCVKLVTQCALFNQSVSQVLFHYKYSVPTLPSLRVFIFPVEVSEKVLTLLPFRDVGIFFPVLEADGSSREREIY